MYPANQTIPQTTPTVASGRRRAHPTPRRLRPTEMTVLTGDGVELAVRDFGHASADHTVVLLHGLCVSDAVWSNQINHLLHRYGDSVRVISYDHRGHGRSSHAHADTYHIDQLAGDLAEVLRTLNVAGRLTLVGHSMGGMTALAYLGRPSAERPVEPRGLVLLATAAGKLAHHGLGRLLAIPGAGTLLRLVDRLPGNTLQSLARPVSSTLSRIWPAQRVMLTAVAGAVADAPMPTAIGFLPGLRRYDQRRTLRHIRARTVIVSGGADPLTPASHSRELAGAIPGATHVDVPHAGHMLPREVPHVVNDAIRRVMAPQSSRERTSRHHHTGAPR